MAATRAVAYGYDKSRTKERSTLGSEAVITSAATWNTFVTAHVRKDGSGYVTVKQDGKLLLDFRFDKESGYPKNLE